MMTTAARLLAASWIASVLIWRFIPAPNAYLCFVAMDVVLTLVFWRLARDRIFPRPLMYLHAAMVLHEGAAFVFGAHYAIFGVVLNRAFELALLYVASCACYRIYVREYARPSAKQQREPYMHRVRNVVAALSGTNRPAP